MAGLRLHARRRLPEVPVPRSPRPVRRVGRSARGGRLERGCSRRTRTGSPRRRTRRSWGWASRRTCSTRRTIASRSARAAGRQGDRAPEQGGVAHLDDPLAGKVGDEADAAGRVHVEVARRSRRRDRGGRSGPGGCRRRRRARAGPRRWRPWPGPARSRRLRSRRGPRSRATGSPSSAKRPCSFMRSVRRSSESRSTRPDPQMPTGAPCRWR